MTPPRRVLIVESDSQVSRWLSLHLSSLWPEVEVDVCPSDEAQAKLQSSGSIQYQLTLLGVAPAAEPPGAPAKPKPAAQAGAGLALLRRLRRCQAAGAIVVLAHQGNQRLAVRALRLGAAEYLERAGLEADELGRGLRRAIARERRRRERLAKRRARAQARALRSAHSTIEAPAEGTVAAQAERDQVPGFQLRRILGGSHTATVWLAHSDALGCNVALKIGSESLDEENARPHLEEERRAVARLQHPSIIDVFGYGVHEGREYLAMEYFPCGDLKRRMQNPLPISGALRYTRRIAMALAVVHGAGLVHRDLKPHNVMLRPDASVVLIDFGLARLQNSTTHRTAVGVLRGSPYYMSPEQAGGADLDGRSDLYSLGVMLYEMLTGVRPYTGNSAIELMDQHVTGKRPALPLELSEYERLVSKLMAVEPAERYQKAEELLQDLNDLQNERTATNIQAVYAHAG